MNFIEFVVAKANNEDLKYIGFKWQVNKCL